MAEPGLGLWIRLALRHHRFLAGTALLAGVLALGVAFLIPKTYRARASVLPPHEADPVASLRGLSGGLGLEMDLPFSAGVTLFDVYLGILDSESVARTLVDRFDLQAHYDASSRVNTLRQLRKNTRIQPTLQGVLEVLVDDEDPELAAALANAYIDELDRVFGATRSGSARRQREFLEERVRVSWSELDSLEIALTRIQTDRGITALGRDATEAALAAGGLMGRRLALSVRLEMLNELRIGSAPLKQELESELRAVEAEIAKLPGLGLDLARSLRDLRIAETLHEALIRQLEAARLEEVRDTPTVEILDRAVVPDRHARPRKSLVTLAGLALGLGLAFGWVVWSDPVP